MFKLKRILQNEEGASPGGGAPQTPAPAVVPTQGAATPASIPIDQVKAVVGEMLGEFRNGFFADLRKSGALGKEKPATEAPTTTAPIAPVGVSMADVQALLAKESVATTLAVKNGLTSTQAAHMKSALANVSADQYEAAGTTWLTELGLVKATAPPAPATTAATAAPTTPPAAAPSAPTGHGLPTEGGVLNVFSLTPQQIKEVGPAGIRAALEKLQTVGNSLAGMPTRPKPPNQR